MTMAKFRMYNKILLCIDQYILKNEIEALKQLKLEKLLPKLEKIIIKRSWNFW